MIVPAFFGQQGEALSSEKSATGEGMTWGRGKREDRNGEERKVMVEENPPDSL